MLYLLTINTVGSPAIYNTPHKIYKTKEEALKEQRNVNNIEALTCNLYTFKEEDGVYEIIL